MQINTIQYELNKIKNIEDTITFLNSLELEVQSTGGRKVKIVGKTGKLCLNDLVKHAHNIISKEKLNFESIEKAEELIETVKKIDENLDLKFDQTKKTNILAWVLTKIRRLSNLFFNRKAVLKKNQEIIDQAKARLPIKNDENEKIATQQKKLVGLNATKEIVKETENSTELNATGELEKTFQVLLENARKCVSFTIPKLSVANYGINNFNRSIKACHDSNKKNLVFLKSPEPGRAYYSQVENLKNDQLSFLLSYASGLNVVPPTKVISPEDLSSSPLADFFEEDERIILQEAVQVGKQFHLEEQFPREKIDLSSLQKVILFNMIVGRTDARPANTVLDTEGRLVEVDNEMIGCEKTDCWLMNPTWEVKAYGWVKDILFSIEIRKMITDLDETFITKTFVDMGKEGFVFKNHIENNIVNNFKKIKSFFVENSLREIRIADLIQLNESNK